MIGRLVLKALGMLALSLGIGFPLGVRVTPESFEDSMCPTEHRLEYEELGRRNSRMICIHHSGEQIEPSPKSSEIVALGATLVLAGCAFLFMGRRKPALDADAS